MSTGLTPSQRKVQDTRKSLRTMLEKGAQEFASVLPKHITPERMIRIAMTACTVQPKLLDCTQESVALSLLCASQTGLEPDGYHAHLVPYGKQCQFIPDYKGLIQLALENDVVIDAYAVYEKDTFHYKLGTQPMIDHVPYEGTDRGPIRCAYAVAYFGNNRTKFVVATRGDIEKRRDASKATGEDSPWVKWEAEMFCKGLSINTPIPTPYGWKLMGDLEIGDSVFDLNGQQTPITHKSEIKHLPCFRISFANDEIICDDEHRWIAKIGDELDFNVYPIDVLYQAKQDGLSVVVPVQAPLQIPDLALPIDPYLLGYWLGNGDTNGSRVTCGDNDVEFVRQVVTESRYTLGAVTQDNRTGAWYIGITNGFLEALRTLGILGNKHVPSEYLRSSYQQRLSLLCGLMDSGGHINKSRGQAFFSNTNIQLADAVSELATSLGEYTHRRTFRAYGFGVECIAHQVDWRPTMCCMSNPRKSANYQPRKISAYRPIKTIVKVPSVPTCCIAVESPTHAYLAGHSMTPTHNTAVKMLCKYIPRSQRLRAALVHDDTSEMGLQNNPLTIDVAAARNLPSPLQNKTAATAARVTQAAAPDFDPESGELGPFSLQEFQEFLSYTNSVDEVHELFYTVVDARKEQISNDEYSQALGLCETRKSELSARAGT